MVNQGKGFFHFGGSRLKRRLISPLPLRPVYGAQTCIPATARAEGCSESHGPASSPSQSPPTSSRRRRRGNLVKATICSQAGKAWRPGQANTFVKNKKETKREEEIQRGNSRELFSLFNCYSLLFFFCLNQGCTVTLLLSLYHLLRYSLYNKGFTSDINSAN